MRSIMGFSRIMLIVSAFSVSMYELEEVGSQIDEVCILGLFGFVWIDNIFVFGS